MRYLHTMLRVRDLSAALDFYCNKLGLKEVRRREDEKGRYTNVFLAAPDDPVSGSKDAGRGAPMVELTYNWDSEDYGEARYFGHLAYEVDDIYALCERLMQAGVTINRPPRDGVMAFVRSPDRQSIELLQKGDRCPRRSRGHRCPTPASGEQGAPCSGRGDRRPGQAFWPGNRACRLACPACLPPPANAFICQRASASAGIPRPSSSGLGRRPFTAVTWVRVP